MRATGGTTRYAGTQVRVTDLDGQGAVFDEVYEVPGGGYVDVREGSVSPSAGAWAMPCPERGTRERSSCASIAVRAAPPTWPRPRPRGVEAPRTASRCSIPRPSPCASDLRGSPPWRGPSGSAPLLVTPADRPAITNARSVFGLDYVSAEGARLGTLLLLETEGAA